MKKIFGFAFIIFVIAAGIVISSCKKEEEYNKSERFLLLTNHVWKLDTVITICKDPEIIWFVDVINEDAKGSIIIFSADGMFTSEFESGKWKFNNGETEVIAFDDEDPSDILQHFRIDVLTDDILKITDLADVPPSDTCYLKGRYIK